MPRPNDPYARPGTQDMTADVNFTALARAGQRGRPPAGPLRPRARRGRRRAAGAARAAADETNRIAEFLGNPVFKVLVLGTRATDASPARGPLLSPLPALPRTTRQPSAGGDQSGAGPGMVPTGRSAPFVSFIIFWRADDNPTRSRLTRYCTYSESSSRCRLAFRATTPPARRGERHEAFGPWSYSQPPLCSAAAWGKSVTPPAARAVLVLGHGQQQRARGNAGRRSGTGNSVVSGAGGNAGNGSVITGAAGGGVTFCDTRGVAITSQVPRLSNAQYDRVVNDLLGVQTLTAANGVQPSTILATDQAGGLTELGWSSYQTVGRHGRDAGHRRRDPEEELHDVHADRRRQDVPSRHHHQVRPQGVPAAADHRRDRRVRQDRQRRPDDHARRDRSPRSRRRSCTRSWSRRRSSRAPR